MNITKYFDAQFLKLKQLVASGLEKYRSENTDIVLAESDLTLSKGLRNRIRRHGMDE